MTSLTLSTSAVLALAVAATAQITPLSSFGTNGWLAPGSSAFLNSAASTERGMAYNPATGNLVLVSRAGGNNVRIIDGATGTDLGGLDTTGVSGGTFAVNMAGCGDDGAIYVGNLAIGANFKVYKWNDETLAVAPSTAFDGATGASRAGDSFAVFGGATARFAAAGSSNALNSNFYIGRLDGTNGGTFYSAITGTGTASNDYRLSLTFVDATNIIGNQGGLARYTNYTGATATVVDSIPLGGAAQRALDYTTINGTPVLAVIDSNSSNVSVFDITAPATPILIGVGNATTGTLASNGNGSGSVQWGAVNGNTATLYAMNTNQGIQAFEVTIGQASSSNFGTGCGAPAFQLDASAAPVLGTSFDLVTSNGAPAAGLHFYVLGFVNFPAGLPLPFGGSGCSQYIDPLVTVAIPAAAGSATLSQNYPASSIFVGVPVYAQALAFDAGALFSTNGTELILGNY